MVRDPFSDCSGTGHCSPLGRRTFIGLLGGTASLLLPIRPARAWQAARVFTPEEFGAAGDGRTDDYDALIRLAAAVSASGGGIVRFGRGKHYRIDRVQIRGGPNRNGIINIVYRGCRHLSVDLNAATIDVKGDFHRAAEASNGRRSWSNAVIPFQFIDCIDLTVENGTIVGNAERMTRDAGVVEGPGHGISLHGCDDVVLRNLHIHHISTDAIVLRPGGGSRPCRNVELREVRLTHNGRQGLTNGGGQQVVAYDSHFSETGLTGGSYRHAPMAGVDVEPHPGEATRSDFRAVNCRFDNNRGAPVVAGSPDLARQVELVDCSGRADEMRRLILSAEQAVIRGGSWHNIQIACAYAAHRPFRHGISIEVSGGEWSGDNPEWAPLYDLNAKQPTVRIHGNRFALQSARPFAAEALFQCSNPNHRFEENHIFVTASGHDGNGDDLIGRFAGAQLRGNRWSTDVSAPLRFVNNYAEAGTVEGELFSDGFAALGRG